MSCGKSHLVYLFFIYSSYSVCLSGEDSDSDSDLSLEEERSLSIPSSESEDNVRLRGRIQRRFKRTGHGERLLTEPSHNSGKGTDIIVADACIIIDSEAKGVQKVSLILSFMMPNC